MNVMPSCYAPAPRGRPRSAEPLRTATGQRQARQVRRRPGGEAKAKRRWAVQCLGLGPCVHPHRSSCASSLVLPSLRMEAANDARGDRGRASPIARAGDHGRQAPSNLILAGRAPTCPTHRSPAIIDGQPRSVHVPPSRRISTSRAVRGCFPSSRCRGAVSTLLGGELIASRFAALPDVGQDSELGEHPEAVSGTADLLDPAVGDPQDGDRLGLEALLGRRGEGPGSPRCWFPTW